MKQAVTWLTCTISLSLAPARRRASMVPGLLLASLYILCLIVVTLLRPEYAPVADAFTTVGDSAGTAGAVWSVLVSLLPPSLLILAVLGSIFFGIATPSEAAGVGALGAMVLAVLHRRLNMQALKETCHGTAK